MRQGFKTAKGFFCNPGARHERRTTGAQSLIDRLAVPENGPAGSIRSGYCDILAELPGASGNTGRAWQETL